MRILILLFLFVSSQPVFSQTLPSKPCSTDPLYRQFDFWLGEWDVVAPNGNHAGDSKISLILDSCIVLEEWTGNYGYAGKSFNSYNAKTKQWQQYWVDNGGTVPTLLTESLKIIQWYF